MHERKLIRNIYINDKTVNINYSIIWSKKTNIIFNKSINKVIIMPIIIMYIKTNIQSFADNLLYS